MISIRESNDHIDQICLDHINFIKPYVKSMIGFYIDIFELLPSIQKKRLRNKTVIDQIKAIKNRHSCNHYKRLLKYLLKGAVELKKDEQLIKFKKEGNLISAAKKNTEILIALRSLMLNFEQILSLDFSNNQVLLMKTYSDWMDEYKCLNFLLQGIFDYELWFSSLGTHEVWGPYQLAIALNIRSCAYCNRHYTFSLQDINGKKMGRPDFDHFLPKAINPLLALSFYNLVPSCKECNGSAIKGAKPVKYDTHINPYEDNLKSSNMRFTYYPITYEASIGMDEELEINLKYAGDKLNILLKEKVEGNIELFSLDKIYKSHTDIVQEIIRKRSISNDRYIENLQKTFNHFPLDIDEAYRLAFGNYYNESEFHKRPISKLTKDISIEMGTLVKIKPANS